MSAKHALLLLTSLWAASGLFAQTTTDLWPVPVALPDAPYPGAPVGLEIEGDRLYLATRDTVAVIDIGDPERPAFLGASVTTGTTQRIAIANGLAYLVGYHDGLRIVSVADPRAGVPNLGHYPLSGSDSLTGLGLAGERVFASGHGTGLLVFDATHADEPELVGAVEHDLGTTDYFAGEDVRIVDDLVYLAGHDDDWGAVTIYRDVPGEDPRFLGDFRVFDVPGIPPTGACRRIELAGEVAFVVDTGLGLYLLDVRDPTAPVLLPAPDGETALLETVDDFALSSGHLLAADVHEFRVFDLEKPEEPVERGFLELSRSDLGTSVKVAAQGTMAFVAGDRGLVAIDFSDPVAPAIVGSLPLTGRRVRDLEIAGDHAYTVGEDGVGVLALSGAAPLEVGRGGSGSYRELAVSGDRAAARQDRGYRLDLFDLGPEGIVPELGRSLELPFLQHFDLENERLYVVRSNMGLTTHDVSKASAPTEIGHWSDPTQRIGHLEVRGRTLFAGSPDLGFAIYNVSTPSEPGLLGFLGETEISRFVIDGSLVYGVRWAPGGPAMQLVVIDVSDLSRPRIIGTANGPGYHSNVRALVVSEGFVFASLWNQEPDVQIFDVRDPNLVLPVRRDFPGGEVEQFAAHEGLLYVARGYGGLQVFDASVTLPKLSFRPTPGQALPVHFTWDAPVGIYFGLEASRNLRDWTSMGLFDREGLEEAIEETHFGDPDAPAFFRARSR